MKRTFMILLGFGSFLSILSCSEKQEKRIELKTDLYVDSLRFRHYNKSKKPFLLLSTTYAYNDSMSQVLDGSDLELLKSMNSTDHPYSEPLLHEQYSDTLVVSLIYSRTNSTFVFGEIRTREDSIFVTFSGDTFKDVPEVSRRYSVPHRFYRSEFRILVDTTKNYSIFFRHVDSFEGKHQ